MCLKAIARRVWDAVSGVDRSEIHLVESLERDLAQQHELNDFKLRIADIKRELDTQLHREGHQ